MAGAICVLIHFACKPTPSDIATLALKGDEVRILKILDRVDEQFAPPDRIPIINACIEAGTKPSFRDLRQRVQSLHLESKLPPESERLLLIEYAKNPQQTDLSNEYLRLYFDNEQFNSRAEVSKFIKAVTPPHAISNSYIQLLETRLKTGDYSGLLRLTIAYSNISARPISSTDFERVQSLVTRSDEFATASKELVDGERELTEIQDKVHQARDRIREIQLNEPKGNRIVARVLNKIRPPLGYEIALENGVHAVLYSFRSLQFQAVYAFLVDRIGDEAIELRPEFGGGLVNMPKLIEVEKTDWLKSLEEAKRNSANHAGWVNSTARMVKFRETRVTESRLAFQKALGGMNDFVKELRESL